MIMMSGSLWRTPIVTNKKVEEIKKRINVETCKTLRNSKEEVVPLLTVMDLTVDFNT